MINTVALTGRMTKDPDLKYTQSGKAVATFSLAVDRNFKDNNGNKITDFPRCVIWGKNAENLANYTHKGSLIGVTGMIATRTFEDKNGQKRFACEIIVEHFTLLEKKQQGQVQHNNQNNGYQNRQNMNNNQFNNQSNDPFENVAPDIGYDDLPF